MLDHFSTGPFVIFVFEEGAVLGSDVVDMQEAPGQHELFEDEDVAEIGFQALFILRLPLQFFTNLLLQVLLIEHPNKLLLEGLVKDLIIRTTHLVPFLQLLNHCLLMLTKASPVGVFLSLFL